MPEVPAVREAPPEAPRIPGDRLRFPGILLSAAAAILSAVALTFPLVLNLSTAIPGKGPGDNIAFLWNFWWVRVAIEKGLSLFETPYLFVPDGVPLALHAHVLLPALLGQALGGSVDLVLVHNLTLLATLAANVACTYLLARHVALTPGPALFAALLSGCSSYIAAHLNGHFNLISAWVLPLAAWAALRFVQSSGAGWRMLGVVLGLCVYVDYYYALYSGLVVAVVWLEHRWSLRVEVKRPPAIGRLSLVLAALAGAVALSALAIHLSGGMSVELPWDTVDLRGTYNLRQAFWALCLLAALSHWRPRLAISPAGDGSRLRLISVAWCGATALVIAGPMLWHLAGMVAGGDYVSQRVLWRSSPSGVDLGTLVLGPPFSAVAGDAVRGFYDRFAIDAIEQSAWLGLVAAALAGAAIVRGRMVRQLRVWLWIGGAAFVWALGPHLIVLGQDTGMILPGAFTRYVPGIGNARMPGRAMVLVHLSVALLAGHGFAHLVRTRGRAVAAAVCACAVVEMWIAPFPLTKLERPQFIQAMRNAPNDGGVLSLPLGLRDGFGETGRLDPMSLWHQTLHERPMPGGFVSRLPPRVARSYQDNPVLRMLLNVSAGEHADPMTGTALIRQLVSLRIRYVLLNRAMATPALMALVENAPCLTIVGRDDRHTLYSISAAPGQSCS